MSAWWVIAKKELATFFRDRRALLNQVLLPVLLMPLFMFAPTLLVEQLSQGAVQKVQKIAVAGLPQAVTRALAAARLQLVPEPDPATAVREGRADAGLVFVSGSYRVYARVSQDGLKAQVVVDKVRQVLEAQKREMVARTLRQAGLDPSVLEPFAVSVEDVSPPSAKGVGFLAFLVPMFLLIFVMNGSLPVVLDVTAGEKEKGTLEALLVTPVGLPSVLFGKMFAALVAAVMSTASGVAGLILGARLAAGLDSGGLQAAGFSLSLTPGMLLAVLVTGVLFAAFAVSLQLMFGIFARSYKEAQGYMSVLYLLLVLPAAMLGFVSGFVEVGPGLLAIPVVGPFFFIDQVLRAKADLLGYAVTWGSSALYALAALFLAYLSFSREEVVFRN